MAITRSSDGLESVAHSEPYYDNSIHYVGDFRTTAASSFHHPAIAQKETILAQGLPQMLIIYHFLWFVPVCAF